MEKLDFLIDYLIKENEEILINKLPKNEKDKENLWRSLCNIRSPKEASDKYIKIENEYLQEKLKNGIITNVEDIKPLFNNKICLWEGDITTLKIDTIVNAANSQGLGCFIPCHKCIDNQIHTFAGLNLRLECREKMREIGVLKTGKAFITKGYNLPSKYVIHTVGPIIYQKVTNKEIEQLKKCYINSMKIAKENEIKSIAFPCISTGEFKFPKKEASKIAIESIEEYLEESGDYFDKIVFNVFTDEDYDIYFKNLGERYGR